MAIIAKQTGQNAEYYILYEILKKLDQLVKVTASTLTTTTTSA